MPSKVTSPSDSLRPSEFVRIEAAALNELAARLGTIVDGQGEGTIVNDDPIPTISIDDVCPVRARPDIRN